jgi:hypothetical protein
LTFPLHVPSLFAPQPCARCGVPVDALAAAVRWDETDDLFGGRGPGVWVHEDPTICSENLK